MIRAAFKFFLKTNVQDLLFELPDESNVTEFWIGDDNNR